MKEDYIWFKNNYQSLQEKYGNAFLAIKNKQILGVYSSYGEGVEVTAKSEPMGTFIVQECNRDFYAYIGSIASMNF